MTDRVPTLAALGVSTLFWAVLLLWLSGVWP